MPANVLKPLIQGLKNLLNNHEIVQIADGTPRATDAMVFSTLLPKGGSGWNKSEVSRQLNHAPQEELTGLFLNLNGPVEDLGAEAIFKTLDNLCGLDDEPENDALSPLASICYSGKPSIAEDLEQELANPLHKAFQSHYRHSPNDAETFWRVAQRLIDSLKKDEENADLMDEGYAELPLRRWAVIRYLCACGIAGTEAVTVEQKNMENRLGQNTIPSGDTDRIDHLPSISLRRIDLVDERRTAIKDYVFDCNVEEIHIGRNEDNDVRVNRGSSPCVSRYHLKILRGEHGWRVVHLGNTNPTAIVDPNGSVRVLSSPQDQAPIASGSKLYLAPGFAGRVDAVVPDYRNGAEFVFEIM